MLFSTGIVVEYSLQPSRVERGNKTSASSTSPIAESTPRPKAHVPTLSRDPLAIRTVVISGLLAVDSKSLWKKIRKCEGAEEVEWPIKRDNGVEDTSTGLSTRCSLSISAHHPLAQVLFSSPAAAQDAVKKLHAHVFKGALLSVTLKKRLDGAAKLTHKSIPTPSRANRLIVRNLPFDVTEQDLRAIFLPHGSVYSIDIPRTNTDNLVKAEGDEPSSLRGKGFAFVWMWNRKEAEAAMNACNGMQVHTGFATALIMDKQKRKKVRREEKKQAGTSTALDDSGRTIAVDWALSKNKWEEEKRDLHEEKASEPEGEHESDEDADNPQSAAEEPDESDDGEASIIDSDHEGAEEDVNDEEKERPSLPQPEAGTTLFIRNIPFLATEDELRIL